MQTLKGIYFWVMAVVVTIVFFLVCAWRHLWLVICRQDDQGRKVHRAASLWGRAIIRLMPGWSVVVEGREHLASDDQPTVIVANHESMSDICAMYYLGIQFRWLSKASVFKIPGVGSAMTWAGYVPIQRGSRESAARALHASEELIRHGVSMFYFPEGTRSVDGVMKPFKIGAFKLARDMQVPVQPVAIHGAIDLLPKHSWIPGKAQVRIKVLPMMPPPARGDTGLEAYAERVRAEILRAHGGLV